MTQRPPVRVANVQAFWGDWGCAPRMSLAAGNLDYLTLDYLAELTMSLLHKQRLREPSLGYPRDFIDLLREILPECKRQGVRIVTNAGGLDPAGCRRAVVELAEELEIADLCVASIDGDDLEPRLRDLMAAGIEFKSLETGRPLAEVIDRILTANVYLGALPIADALAQGADVVVAGRCTDPSLVLGPLIHEFGWSSDDYDRLAAGMIAGHIIECGPHATGGNFEGGWWDVPDMARIGYPIVEVDEDATFVVTKPDNTGGVVNFDTIAEQLLYEMGDPEHYLGPDVTADISAIELVEVAPNRVKVSGIRGAPPPETLKVSAAYSDGFSGTGTLGFSWPSALAKARRMGEVLVTRLDDQRIQYTDLRVDFVGSSAILGRLSPPSDPAEVLMRVSIRSPRREDIVRFGKELAPLGIAGPAGACGFGGRPSPSQVFAYWPTLVPREFLLPSVQIQRVGDPCLV
jgi:hypothetical protein